LDAPMSELLVEDGVVTGAVIQREGRLVRVRARRGVLLATGGFEHNHEWREKYLPEHGREDFSGGIKENTGDGIRAGEEAGASVDLMDDAWWMPPVRHPAGAVIPLVSERSIPPSVIVSGHTG